MIIIDSNKEVRIEGTGNLKVLGKSKEAQMGRRLFK